MTGREERKRTLEKKINKMLKGKSKLYSDYVAACFSEGQQPTSVHNYLQMIFRFMEYIDNPGTEESVKKIRPLDVTGYLNEIRTKKQNDGSVVPTSTSYRSTVYCALRSYFDFLETNEIIDETPLRRIKRPKVTDEKSDQHLSIEEMKDVLLAVKKGCAQTPNSQTHEMHLKSRNEAIMRMLLETGIRASALTCLDVDNIDLENKKLVYVDKGEKKFEKPLTDDLVACLKTWLYDREKLNVKTNALFISEKKKRVSYRMLLEIVKRYTEAVTGKRMSVHKMRHSAITAMNEVNGGDIMLTSHFAGHANVVITQRYIHRDYGEKETEAANKLSSLLSV